MRIFIKCSNDKIQQFDELTKEFKKGYKNGKITTGDIGEFNSIICQLDWQLSDKKVNILKSIRGTKHDNGEIWFVANKKYINKNVAALYYCAFGIKMGWHPVLIYTKENVFVGIWLDSKKVFDGPIFNAETILNNFVSNGGKLMVFDVFDLLESKQDYDIFSGIKNFEKSMKNFFIAIDIDSYNDSDIGCVVSCETVDGSNDSEKRQYKQKIKEKFRNKLIGYTYDWFSAKDFAKIHYFDMNDYDRLISNLVQKYKVLLNNISLEKQCLIASDAALGLFLDDKNVVVIVNSETKEKIERYFESIGLKDCLTEFYETDNERYVDTAIKMYNDFLSRDSKKSAKDIFNLDMKQNFVGSESKNDKLEVSSSGEEKKDNSISKDLYDRFRKLSEMMHQLEKNSPKYGSLKEIFDSYCSRNLFEYKQGIVSNKTVLPKKMLEDVRKLSELAKQCLVFTDFQSFTRDDMKKFSEKVTSLWKAIQEEERKCEEFCSELEIDKEWVFDWQKIINRSKEIVKGYQCSVSNYYNDYLWYSEYMKGEMFQGKVLFEDEDAVENLVLEEGLDNLLSNITNMNQSAEAQKYVYRQLAKIVVPEYKALFKNSGLVGRYISFFREDYFKNIDNQKAITLKFGEVLEKRKELSEKINVFKEMDKIFGAGVSKETCDMQFEIAGLTVKMEYFPPKLKDFLIALCYEEDNNDFVRRVIELSEAVEVAKRTREEMQRKIARIAKIVYENKDGFVDYQTVKDLMEFIKSGKHELYLSQKERMSEPEFKGIIKAIEDADTDTKIYEAMRDFENSWYKYNAEILSSARENFYFDLNLYKKGVYIEKYNDVWNEIKEKAVALIREKALANKSIRLFDSDYDIGQLFDTENKSSRKLKLFVQKNDGARSKEHIFAHIRKAKKPFMRKLNEKIDKLLVCCSEECSYVYDERILQNSNQIVMFYDGESELAEDSVYKLALEQGNQPIEYKVK